MVFGTACEVTGLLSVTAADATIAVVIVEVLTVDVGEDWLTDVAETTGVGVADVVAGELRDIGGSVPVTPPVLITLGASSPKYFRRKCPEPSLY